MTRQIVGISLIRNEDRFIDQAIRNVAAFFAKIIVLENLSTANTWQENERLIKTSRTLKRTR
jgi:alcohol dehydrogenase YqhD (iron-dependent ADH family)